MTEQRKRGKAKPIVVEESGIRVRVFKRGRQFWLDVRYGDNRERVSAKTTVRATAEENARSLALEVARRQLLGITSDTLSLGALFTAYQEHKGNQATGQWRKSIATRKRLFVEAWGAAKPVVSISQTDVDQFAAARRRAWVAKQRSVFEARYPDAEKRPLAPSFRELRDGALGADFRWLSSAFNWARRHKLPNGRRLLDVNPLHDCKWPREQKDNVRRPVASHERYVRTLEQGDRVDSSGRFRLALSLARYTARRIDAILHLRANDLLLKTPRIREALAEAGQNEQDAERMKFGAIRWRADHDKQGVTRIIPIGQAARAEVDRYLEANPRVGDVALMTSLADDKEPLPRSTATKWLVRAERLAELPKLRGGLWHAYRRLWATERKALPEVDVAEAGGWTGTKAMKLSYQRPTADGVNAAVNA